jgi:hypothetical protein
VVEIPVMTKGAMAGRILDEVGRMRLGATADLHGKARI